MNVLHESILRTLLYYDIFDYPLTSSEIYTFLPTNSVRRLDLQKALSDLIDDGTVKESEGFYFLSSKKDSLGQERLEKQNRAKRLWKIAGLVGQLIRRFPFVRAVFISGDLSKNVADKNSDIDFFIITASRKLWICRTFMILFKKIFLLNNKKFFCVNHFISEDHLQVQEKNIYIATEIAHLKPVYNEDLYYRFLDANSWIRDFLPNFDRHRDGMKSRERSTLRTILEFPFRGKWSEEMDTRLLELMKKVWERRYPHLTTDERDRIYKCRKFESRAHGGDFEKRILSTYLAKLDDWGLDEIVSPAGQPETEAKNSSAQFV